MHMIFRRWLYVAQVLAFHFVKHRWLYATLTVLYLVSRAYFVLAINVSESLPNKAFLVVLGSVPTKKNQYVAYHWDRDAFYKPSAMMVKIVGGVAGQAISVNQGNVYVDGDLIGLAKPASKQGTPLFPIEPGQIPPHHIFAKAPHPDSLDSRYSVTGLIGEKQVIGRAYAIF
jgi:conjugal transfer pilin signal peptidase TrbI